MLLAADHVLEAVALSTHQSRLLFAETLSCELRVRRLG
jgi:hypothetical protein